MVKKSQRAKSPDENYFYHFVQQILRGGDQKCSAALVVADFVMIFEKIVRWRLAVSYDSAPFQWLISKYTWVCNHVSSSGYCLDLLYSDEGVTKKYTKKYKASSQGPVNSQIGKFIILELHSSNSLLLK